MFPAELKEIILEAQKIREESWVYSNEEKTNGRYTVDHHEAARQAVGKSKYAGSSWTWIIYLLNYHAWNDIQDWEVS